MVSEVELFSLSIYKFTKTLKNQNKSKNTKMNFWKFHVMNFEFGRNFRIFNNI